jgi:hypothetical protein
METETPEFVKLVFLGCKRATLGAPFTALEKQLN